MASMTPSQIATVVALCGLSVLLVPAHANTFLAPTPPLPAYPPLLEELEEVVGSDRRTAVESRVRRLEEALRPTYFAMPKGPDGGLLPDGVRYLLHRIFVDRHGWFVQGLHAAGESFNSSSPAVIFKEHGEAVHDLFEKRLANHTFTLHHTAVLAATLESFVHSETMERLDAAYRLSLLSKRRDSLTEDQVAHAIDSYMILYVLGANHSNVSQELMTRMHENIEKIYPTWNDTQTWARGVWQEVVRAGDPVMATSFNATVRAVEAIGDRYGRWQDKECYDLKTSLLKLEEAGTGRVRLDTFYQSALDGNWQFSESVGYLRQLGALDESDSKRPSVMIANYINAPSNCVASSKFYSVCCIDECEALLGHLETHIAAPEASPARIVELVEDLPSDTTSAPRTLPTELVNRLEQIADHGKVLLHGRLFGQWMHHAYPRECPYPHLSGTTKPLTPEQWMRQTGEEPVADKETMRWHIDEAKQGLRTAGHKWSLHGSTNVTELARSDLLWSAEEELFVTHAELPQPVNLHARAVSKGASLMGLAALVSVALMILQNHIPALSIASDKLAADFSKSRFLV